MRLPCLPDAKTKTHFLTDFYASEDRFNLPLAQFANYSDKAYLKFYNEHPVRREGELKSHINKIYSLVFQCQTSSREVECSPPGPGAAL